MFMSLINIITLPSLIKITQNPDMNIIILFLVLDTI